MFGSPRVRLLGPLIIVLALMAAACGTSDDAALGAPETPGGTPRAAPTIPPVPTFLATPSAFTVPPTSVDVPGVPEYPCARSVSGSVEGFASVAELAWFAHQVVVGTVVEQRPSVWVDGPDPGTPYIATDYVIQVEQRLRGTPATTLTIRRMGGSINGCQQEFDEPALAIGDRALFFLRTKSTSWRGVPLGDVSYEFLGADQGLWMIAPDGSATTRAAHLLPTDVMSAPLATLTAEIQTALAGSPPVGPKATRYLVPIAVAPAPSPFLIPSPAATP